MGKYYVSSTGNDLNDGSINSPFQSLTKVNAIKTAGDTFLFKSNDVFYGNVTKASPNNDKIVFADYGVGSSPQILGYTSIIGTWLQFGKNIWRIDITNSSNLSGNILFSNTNVGFLLVNKEIKGIKKFNLTLKNQWEFYTDSTYLYVYSEESPQGVKFVSNSTAFELGNNYEIYNLHIEGFGGHGVNGNMVNNTKTINCTIKNIGGSTLSGTTRYGNGWQMFSGGSNNEVTGCDISQCYDVGVTLQGGTGSPGNYTDFINNKIKHNILSKNSQTFEFWARNNTLGFYNNVFSYNDCEDAGYGWGYEARPDKDQSTHLLFYDWNTLSSGVIIEHNNFYRGRNGLIYSQFDIPPVISKNNNIFLRENQPIRFGDVIEIENSDKYILNNTIEENSNFISIPEPREDNNKSYLKSVQVKAGLSLSKNRFLTDAVRKVIGDSNYTRSRFEDFVKESSGSTTNTQLYSQKSTNVIGSTDATKWAPIAEIRLTNAANKVDFELGYMLANDSASPRGGTGSVNIQVITGALLNSSTVAIEVAERVPFSTTVPYSARDFKLLQRVNDGSQIIVTLYYNIGKKAFGKLSYKLLQYYTDAVNADALTIFNLATIANLPSGTQTSPKIIYANNGRTGIANVDYVVGGNESLIAYGTLTAPRTVTLPSATGGVFLNKRIVIKDEAGTANTNNITIVGTIDGSTSNVINTAYGSITINGGLNNWFKEQ